MMKLNKKGITLVEIIISIALISIVLVFLFSLLVNVKDMNDEAEVNSTYLINKSLILKNIESDLENIGDDGLTISETCGIKADIYSEYDINDSYLLKDNELSLTPREKTKIKRLRNASKCLKLSGFSDGTEAVLGIYYYKNKESYVISYIHGNVKATRELPEFEKYNVKSVGGLKNSFVLGYPNIYDDFYKIEIPIIGSDGKDYSIIISYYGKVTVIP